MSEFNKEIPTTYDPFAEANAEDSDAGTKDYVHVRVQQRNGRKSLTTVQGLKKEYSYSKILKDLKKEFCCNGTVVEDPELGQVCTSCVLSHTTSGRSKKERFHIPCAGWHSEEGAYQDSWFLRPRQDHNKYQYLMSDDMI
ncbi:protein translation factor SUI1-like protein [Senna tora]|uniref:Protein translation factor SUI1-like protein n=1 Tax=Senna tora TaxID=362788 RepID=A0A834SYI3_9FABA|nr:protein translation factor SUI1-like protein [Senna tora]